MTKPRKRHRLWLHRITSVGAVPEGDNPGSVITFSKRRRPTVTRAQRYRVAATFLRPLVRGGATGAAAIERALRQHGPGSDAIRDLIALDGSPARLAQEIENEIREETMTPKTPPTESFAKRCERAVHRAAVYQQNTEGKLTQPVQLLRAQIWKSEIGRELYTLKVQHGTRPASAVTKAKLDPEDAAALDFVERWAP